MMQFPAGRWMNVQVKFKMQADIISGVVMDIAAFKVSHSVGCDIDATASGATPVIISRVVMDIAAFKVSHSDNIDATAHISRSVRIHVGIGQRGRATSIDVEPSAIS